jgi:hypothetical protein
MAAAPMKFCVTIWEGFTVKINRTPLRPLPAPPSVETGAGRQLLEKTSEDAPALMRYPPDANAQPNFFHVSRLS